MAGNVKVTSSRDITRTALVAQSTPIAPAELSKLGVKGARVSALQVALRSLGHDIKVDGTFGASTAEALKKLQEKAGVPASGIYGPATRTALRKALQEDAATGGPSLRQGVRGEAVKTLEEKLVKQGLLEKADDYFGAGTTKAVKAFEKKNGVEQDGIVTDALWSKLGNAGSGSGPVLKMGSKGEGVVALQKALAARGLYSGPIDGDFGEMTKAAVNRFEKKLGAEQDGVVGAGIWGKLNTHVLTKTEVGGPFLKKGYSGTAVRMLQNKLKAQKLYDGPIDGKFGDMTEAAVKRLEKKLGVKEPDGAIGHFVWSKLGGAGAGSGPRLKVGSNGMAVEELQKGLKAKGQYDGPIDGDFGPMTQAALKAFQKKNGIAADGISSQAVWKALGKHVVGIPGPSIDVEPKHDYRRTTYDGAVMNVRTKIMLQRAEALAKQMGVRGVPFFVVQGSFSDGSLSGGTHTGGGALDIRTIDRSTEDAIKMVKALRMAGFAAWKRGYGGDPFDKHIHAIAIGDRQSSSAARSQVAEYFRGGDGLTGSAPDGDRGVGRPWPKWAEKYR